MYLLHKRVIGTLLLAAEVVRSQITPQTNRQNTFVLEKNFADASKIGSIVDANAAPVPFFSARPSPISAYRTRSLGELAPFYQDSKIYAENSSVIRHL
jgi:hypothetical protein